MTGVPVVRRISFNQEIAVWGRLVRFSHTIFAMPFALAMFIYVSKIVPVTLQQFLAIIVALIAARTAAMTFNRIVDREIDRLNPRTSNREIPTGLVTIRGAWVLWCVSSLVFFLSAWALGTHCIVLAPLVLAVLCFYSWAKRFTSWSHVILGLSLALAPGGVWYALTAQFALLPLWMMLGVLFWVAGFDILYSCQDIEFDRNNALWSVPAQFGEERAFLIARLFHSITIACFAFFGYKAQLSSFFWLGLFIFAALLLQQHRLVGPGNLKRIDAAFFTHNGLASILFLISVAASVYL